LELHPGAPFRRNANFLDEDGPARAPFGVLLYGGREPVAVTDRIFAVPLSSALGLDE
jgi:hypothetical protein